MPPQKKQENNVNIAPQKIQFFKVLNIDISRKKMALTNVLGTPFKRENYPKNLKPIV